MSILLRVLGLFLLLGFLSSTFAWAAGPFRYRLPQGSGFDPEAVSGKPQPHHTGFHCDRPSFAGDTLR